MYQARFPHGLMFHYFHPAGEGPRDQGSLSADDFEQILLFVGLDNILSPEEWILRLKKQRLKPADVCITFDDGLRCQYDVCLPVLEKYGLRAFWFIYSSVFEGQLGKLDVYRILRTRFFKNNDEFYGHFLERLLQEDRDTLQSSKYGFYYLQRKTMCPFYSDGDIQYRFLRDEVLGRSKFEETMEEIALEAGVYENDALLRNIWLSDAHLSELTDSGHLIGLHSYDHPTAIAQLSYEEQLSQYTKNFCHIASVCGKKPVSMSHPCNSFNEGTIRILRGLGVGCGFISNMGVERAFEDRLSHKLQIPREDSTEIIKQMRSCFDK